MGNRRLFGEVYGGLDPEYFFNMPSDSGVFLMPTVLTSHLKTSVSKPGDVDLMVLPYEGDEIMLHKALAVEIKAVRASFLRQGKSPNSMGFSQAAGLKKMGFPVVAVAHLIVSDESPRETWRTVGAFQVVKEDQLVQLADREFDLMPADLMERVFYRLRSKSPDEDIGLASAYLGSTITSLTNTDGGVWLPWCRPAKTNAEYSRELLVGIAEIFENNAEKFLDTPRFDPS